MTSKPKVNIQAIAESEKRVLPSFTREELAQIERMAKKKGMTATEFVETSVMEQIEKITKART